MSKRFFCGVLILSLCALGAAGLSAQQSSPAGELAKTQLQRLVAPVALYPDALVAQVLAASSYPHQIAAAAQWIHQHPDLRGKRLASAVDRQDWHASVKAVTEYPKVLAELDGNLAWTTALGKAYAHQPDAVMDAIQTLRKRAINAGVLYSGDHIVVSERGGNVAIAEGSPRNFYVPSYNPWLSFGPALAPWPGYFLEPGLPFGPGLSFGFGYGLGYYAPYPWGWTTWYPDWNAHRIYHQGREWHAGQDRGHRPAAPSTNHHARAPRP